jgi:hypothetical protein
MKIFVKIFEGKEKEPYRIEATGNFALETVLIKLMEKFFGVEGKRKIEEWIKERI